MVGTGSPKPAQYASTLGSMGPLLACMRAAIWQLSPFAKLVPTQRVSPSSEIRVK